ncbi:protein ecdysoneless homolog [Maniola jurtina]|uniref:protein ecdysoneless homolog n=1 Tax=Maniola jurtina TaxID=191418 RepID=UPI001E68D59D|nr:protein ecdysoneless homolog [Maniola jurtina]
MTKRLFQILSLIAIFAVNGIKSDDTIKALRKILKELNAPTEDNDEGNHNSKIVYLPSHYKHAQAKFKGGKSAPNLMNIQTMNLFLKPKRQRSEADVKKFLRLDAENRCKATGRCGCSGARCGHNKEEDLTYEVDRVLNEVNKQLAREDDKTRYDRDIVNLEKRDEDRNRDIDENHQQRDRDNEDRIKNDGKYFDDVEETKHTRDNDEYDDERDSKNRVDRENLLNSKRIKINDNLDVVILDKSDLDLLLRNEDFLDPTRKDVDKDGEDKEMFQKVLKGLKKFANAEDKASERSKNVVTPEEFFGHYETIKQLVVAKVFDYVKDKKLSSFLKLKHISPYQRSKLRSIKLKYKRGEMKDDAIEEEIVNIIFGQQSNMKIVSQTENDNKIFVPKWLYDKILSYKNSINNNLRTQNAQKRILPLTLQQKERLNKKSLVEQGKTIPKLVWRKNAGHDLQKFGIPFDLDVHGLAQMAV